MIPAPRYNCAVDAAMSVIEGKWKCTIICLLGINGSMRFNEILKAIGEISSRMLSKQLKELEEDGIVTRTINDKGPLKISYSLTDKGRSLGPVLNSIAEWGLKYQFPNRITIEES